MPEITKPKPERPRDVPRYVWILFAALTVFVYFFGLTIPLLGPDESRYSQVAREMWQAGDWITPTLGGFHWFEKPVLLYWLQIAAYNLFGVTEFAARIGPAIFGLGTVASLWIHGRSARKSQISNFRSEISSSHFANWLALIAASTLGILAFARGASFDIIITFPLTAALASFFVYDQSTEAAFAKRTLPLSLFYVFIGLSVLAKGLIGILFPFSIVGFYYLLSRRMPTRTFLASLIWGTILAFLVAAVWYVPMYKRHGYEFINEFFIQHHFQRFTSNKYQHPQPFYFFLWVLPLMTFPWTPFFITAIWRQISQRIRRVSTSPGLPVSSSPLLLFSLSWLLVPLVFFSISGSKLPGYILPAVPAAIIVTAVFVFELVERSSKWQKIVLTTAVATLVGVVALLVFAVPRFADSDSVKPLIAEANSRGFSGQRVFMVYTLSHNAEFYAPGRLLRDESGKQKTFYHVDDLLPFLAKENGGSALALVPIEHLIVLTRDDRIRTEVIKDNTELAIAAISLR